MQVVLLHDWLTGFRGGERVLEVFCELFPDAPLYTLIYVKDSTSACIENRKITSSFLSSVPGIKSQYRKFLPLFPKAAESLKILEKADLIISSSHCVIKGVKKPEGSKHLSYIHSPMRYLYDQYDVYFGKDAPFYQQMGAKVFKDYLVNWDKKSNENVDFAIANSSFVQKRITEFYGIGSDVIHPFVDLEDFAGLQKNPPSKENFYLMVSAFAPNKRVDLAVKVFNKLGLPLKIIGSGQKEKELRAMASSNIEFLGNLSRNDVIKYFFKAKGFIFPGVEDFGITPLESLAAGTPVIAYKEGGVLETLNESVAVFFDKQDEVSLEKAIEKFEQTNFERSVLESRARDFSKEIFKRKIMDYINTKVMI